MTNEQTIAKIMELDVIELLEWILSSPTDLTDSYYSEFRDAINERAKQLGAFKNE